MTINTLDYTLRFGELLRDLNTNAYPMNCQIKLYRNMKPSRYIIELVRNLQDLVVGYQAEVNIQEGNTIEVVYSHRNHHKNSLIKVTLSSEMLRYRIIISTLKINGKNYTEDLRKIVDYYTRSSAKQLNFSKKILYLSLMILDQIQK